MIESGIVEVQLILRSAAGDCRVTERDERKPVHTEFVAGCDHSINTVTLPCTALDPLGRTVPRTVIGARSRCRVPIK
jgi:hypothetical protein